ncbi:MAG TPA: hypothetical protein DEF45_00110 [Rhodopirellula sp.]|nr:hypothetical protein [Rhodopirellula sp.]
MFLDNERCGFVEFKRCFCAVAVKNTPEICFGVTTGTGFAYPTTASANMTKWTSNQKVKKADLSQKYT